MQFAVIGLNHGHIWGQVDGLLKNVPNARCTGFFAPEKELCEEFARKYPDVPFREKNDLLRDSKIDLIVSASINFDRGPLAVKTLNSGKNFFVDKPACATSADVQAIARALETSGKQLFVFFSERLCNPLDIKAKQIVDSGEIGQLVHLMGLGPHKLIPSSRPQWMWNPQQYGGILNDIASHQVDWFVWMTGSRIQSFSSRVGHYDQPGTPETFENFGDVTLLSENGVTGFARVDWFTPEKMPAFGDVRGVIVGTQGTIELRRTTNIAAKDSSDTGAHMVMTTHCKPPHRIDAGDCVVNWPTLIADSIRDGKNYLTDHATLLHVIDKCVQVQAQAVRINTRVKG